MDKNSKRKVAGGAVYVFCAFMLVSILSIAMLTAIGNRKPDAKTPQSSSGPVQTDTGTRSVTEPPDTDAIADTSAADSGSAAESAQASSVPYKYYMPINGYISKSFNTELAVWSPTMNDYRAHCGIDIEAPQGNAVKAFADGVISAVYRDQFMGDCVCIDHDGGMKSYYMNLSGEYPSDVFEGACVACGQTIGSVGSTAALEAAEPSHLHFEVRVDGKSVDPLEYLDYDPIAVQSYEDTAE